MRTRILDFFSFFVLCGILVDRKSTAGQITQNDVSLEWINDFYFQISSTKCQSYSVTTSQRTRAVDLPGNLSIMMNGNAVNLNFTKCNGTKSPPVHIVFHYPELVKNVDCYQISKRDAVCSWIPTPHVQELKFFYVFVTEKKINEAITLFQLSFKVKECPSYIQVDGIRTGCNLQMKGTHIYISFRGGEAKNTFRIPLSVKPPPLKWNISQMEDKFHVRWNYPEISADWKFMIRYNECNNLKFKDINTNQVSTELDRVPKCPYRLAIQATSSRGNTPWTEDKYFDAESPHSYTYAAVFFPILFAGLVAVAFFCFRRNKDRLFPKIPQPRNLLSGISDSKVKAMPEHFYPNSKEELCKISFVTELHCGNMKPMKHPLL